MVKQDAAGRKNVIAFAVIDRHPVRIQLGHAVRAAWIKGRRFNLRNRLHLAKHFRGTGLIKLDLWIDDANRFKQVHWANARDLGGGEGLFKRHPHKTLRSEVIDFSRARGLQQTNT